jgi:hypothetical protein
MMMRKTLLGWLSIGLLVLAACGGSAATNEAATGLEDEMNDLEPTIAAAVEEAAPQLTAVADQAEAGGCEPYFRFCAEATLRGTVETQAAGGVGANIPTCAEWAATGDSRILELPMMLNAGDPTVNIALTRIGQYTGPGSYTLEAVAAEGMPDMFPAIQVGGRAFNNGPDSTAVATINADGSGSIEATGLVEIASVTVSDPDPSARVDLSMQWTCQDS